MWKQHRIIVTKIKQRGSHLPLRGTKWPTESLPKILRTSSKVIYPVIVERSPQNPTQTQLSPKYMHTNSRKGTVFNLRTLTCQLRLGGEEPEEEEWMKATSKPPVTAVQAAACLLCHSPSSSLCSPGSAPDLPGGQGNSISQTLNKTIPKKE